MHILADVMSKVRQDEIRPKVQRVMQLERIREVRVRVRVRVRIRVRVRVRVRVRRVVEGT